MVRSGVHSYLPARTSRGELVIAHAQTDAECEDFVGKPVEGILEPMSRSDLDDLHARGLIGNDHAAYELALVSFHPKENALIGLLLCGLGVAFGVFLVPLARAVQGVRGRYWQWLSEASTLARSTDPAQRGPATRSRIQLAVVSIGLGIVCMMLRGWAVWGVIPVPWVGIAAILAGLFWVAKAITR
jgi:hypothetical protein